MVASVIPLLAWYMTIFSYLILILSYTEIWELSRHQHIWYRIEGYEEDFVLKGRHQLKSKTRQDDEPVSLCRVSEENWKSLQEPNDNCLEPRYYSLAGEELTFDSMKDYVHSLADSEDYNESYILTGLKLAPRYKPSVIVQICEAAFYGLIGRHFATRLKPCPGTIVNYYKFIRKWRRLLLHRMIKSFC